MSIVGDLREALQDVVAPDLKAVVRGLSDLLGGLAQLREEMHAGNAQLREELRAIDERLREDTRQHVQLLREEMRSAEVRSIERLENLQTVLRLELANRRVVELEEQLRAKSSQAQ